MGKRPGHSYRRFHTHVGKMVALSTVSMNNLGRFAPLETFLSVFSFYRAEAFSSSSSGALSSRGKNYRRRERNERTEVKEKHRLENFVRCNEQRSRDREKERERERERKARAKLFLSADGIEISLRHCNYKFRKLYL